MVSTCTYDFEKEFAFVKSIVSSKGRRFGEQPPSTNQIAAFCHVSSRPINVQHLQAQISGFNRRPRRFGVKDGGIECGQTWDRGWEDVPTTS